jgi:hypothetical protein
MEQEIEFLKSEKIIYGLSIYEFINNISLELQNPNNFVQIGQSKSSDDFLIVGCSTLYISNPIKSETFSVSLLENILTPTKLEHNITMFTIELFPFEEKAMAHIFLPKNVSFISKKPYKYFLKPDSFLIEKEKLLGLKERFPKRNLFVGL